MQKLIDSGETIPPNLDALTVSQMVNDFLRQEPLASLTQSQSPGCFYIFFTRTDRLGVERTAFLTQRGGSYSSSSGAQIIQKASRPVLTHQDGTLISPSELWDSGFQLATIHESRNPTISAAIEKLLHQSTLHLPLGQRLHRNYCGGAKWKPDVAHMMFGVYIVFNHLGHRLFIVNEKTRQKTRLEQLTRYGLF